MIHSENGTTDNEYLHRLRQQIEHQLQWGTADNWRHHDFVQLSDKVFEKTGQQLSHSTLKRIWGKLEYRSLPNTHTLNILAQFADHENWLMFKSSQLNGRVPANGTTPMEVPSSKRGFGTVKPLRIAAGVALCFLLGWAALSLVSAEAKKPLEKAMLETVQFGCRPVAEGVPNTVIFNYDVSQVDAGQFQIQQTWDDRRRFVIDKNKSEVASTYYYPGHWKAKLVIDDEVVREHDVYIKSNGWVVTLDRDPIPRYLEGEELFEDGFLALSENMKREVNARTDPPERLSFHYIDDFGDLHSDDFSLSVRFRNTYTKGDGACRFTRLVIDCTDGVFIIPFSIPGCVGDLSMRFNDVGQVGSQHDFSEFGCDFSRWNDFRISVQNRMVRLYLNGVQIHEVAYLEDAGMIAGMRMQFTGMGELDDVRLENGAGDVLLEDSFEKKEK